MLRRMVRVLFVFSLIEPIVKQISRVNSCCFCLLCERSLTSCLCVLVRPADNEHMFVDLEDRLAKYFPKEWKQDSGKGNQKRWIPPLLCLKVQYYVENGRLICERKARRLYYADLRERVLRSECRQQEEVYFQLAGYALQADLGDHPPENSQQDAPYFRPKDYFPPWIVAKRGVDYLLCHGPKVHRELWGMPCRDAVLLFIRESCRLEDVPVTFYRLHKDKREEKGSALLGLTLRGMQVYQEMNNVRELLYDFPWTNVGRLTFLGKKFEIQPDGLPSARKLVYYTGSAFRSRHLLLHLSSSHRLYLTLQPALTHLRQLEQDEEKKRYRESYISDDMDPDPLSSDGSPLLSRHSTSSSGIEADGRQRSVSVEMVSVEEEDKTRPEEEEWHDEDFQQHVNGPGEVSVDDPEETLRLAELLQGVSVDCPSLSSEINSAGEKNLLMGKKLTIILLFFTLQVLKWKTRGSSERHSHSLDDVRLMPRPLLLSTLPNTSRSYTFGLGTGADPQKPTFYGRRSTNCLALDLLEDEQFLELVL
uniref:FERM domain containing 1 n=1 Tax=Astyanax mexicanus TaxID=7994 RepID=A0A3B1J063_ASTMX